MSMLKIALRFDVFHHLLLLLLLLAMINMYCVHGLKTVSTYAGYIKCSTMSSSKDSDGDLPLSDDEGKKVAKRKGLLSKVVMRRRDKDTSLPITATRELPIATLEPYKLGKSVGIDLGTTFSAISIVENGKPKIIPVQGKRTMASIVTYMPNGVVFVGEAAREQLLINSLNTFTSVKRLIGKSTIEEVSSDVSRKKGRYRKSSKDNSSSSMITLQCPQLKEVALLPEQVSSEVLKVLLQAAQYYLKSNEPIRRAVITIPAYFLPTQCAATERAGRLAGLEKIKLLREPEAAALAYGLTKERVQQIVLVFDLGGGTFDVSVLEVGNGFVEVIATSGDADLGGDDFDQVIYQWLLQQIESAISAEAASYVNSNHALKNIVVHAAEDAKIRLSSETTVNISLVIPLPSQFMMSSSASTALQDISLSRGKFESLSKLLLQRILKPVREAAIMAGVNLAGESGQLSIDIDDADTFVDDNSDSDSNEASTGDESVVISMKKQQQLGRLEAKLRKKAQGSSVKELRRLQKSSGDASLSRFPGGRGIDNVIMVGGATRMPCVVRLVRSITGFNPLQTVNPDEAVSLGAAIQAGILDGDIPDMQVVGSLQAAIIRALSDPEFKFN